MGGKAKKPVVKPLITNKVFKNKMRGALGQLTFGDIGSLMQLLKKYKDEVPPGFTRKKCHACIIKTGH